MRRALEYARRPRRRPRRALRGRGPRRRRAHARRRLVEPARHRRTAGARRGGDARPRSRPRAAHRRADALPPPVDRRLGRADPPGQGRGAPGHRRGDAAPPLAHRRSRSRATTRSSRSTRRCAPRSTSTAVRAGLASGAIDAIATDHAPHPAERKDEPFDEAPSGHARARDRARGRLRRARRVRTDASSPAELFGALSTGARRGSPASTVPARAGRSRAGAAANLWSSTRPPMGRRPEPAGEPEPEHALRRPQAHGQGPPHGLRRRARRRRRGGAALSETTRRAAGSSRHAGPHGSSSPTARCSRERRSARCGDGADRHAASSCSTPPVGLPGDHHRPLLRRPGDRVHLSPHRQLRRHARRRGEPAGPSAGA